MEMSPVTGRCLQRMQASCNASGIRLIVAIVPEFPEQAATIPKSYQGIPLHIPDNLEPADYTCRSGHFTDSGHRKFAEMLKNAVQGQR